MTISITVLVMEGSGALQLTGPLMVAVFVAKMVGDALTPSIYDVHIKIRGAPVLVSIPLWSPGCGELAVVVDRGLIIALKGRIMYLDRNETQRAQTEDLVPAMIPCESSDALEQSCTRLWPLY